MQRNPVLQVSLAPQQAWPAPPQAEHIMPPSAPSPQLPPGWQVLPGQQAAPTAPHAMQMFGPVPGGFAQPRFAAHTLPGQQFWPLAPHGWQLSPVPPSGVSWQEWLAAHWFAAAPPQHCCPAAPQASQTGGATPGGSTQMLRAEQVPSPVPPGQQGWPVAPQALQTVPPSALGRHAPPAWHESSGQQAALSAPHAMQLAGGAPGGLTHWRPALHIMPVQQA
jgi:hypothetical protein